MATMFVNGSERNQQALKRTFHKSFLPSFVRLSNRFQSCRFFIKCPIRNKNCLRQPCLLIYRGEISNLQSTFHRCFLPNIGSFCQAVSAEKIFQKSTNQKQELPLAAMFVDGSKRNEHSSQRTFHILFLPSFGSFGKEISQGNIFKNRPLRNKNCLWQPCLLMDRGKMCNLYRGYSIDVFYQVTVNLAMGFQRRRLEYEKFTDDGRQVMAKSHFAFGKVR